MTTKLVLSVALVLCLAVAEVRGHAVVIQPRTRQGATNTQRFGVKLTHSQYGTNGGYPFTQTTMDQCNFPSQEGEGMIPGGQSIFQNVDAGTYQLQYKLTLPHPGTPEYTAVRFRSDANAAWVPLAENFQGGSGTISNGVYPVNVVIPAGPHPHAQLQFIWDSTADGGGYIECADICVQPNCPGPAVATPAVAPYTTVQAPVAPTPAPTPGTPPTPTPTPGTPAPTPGYYPTPNEGQAGATCPETMCASGYYSLVTRPCPNGQCTITDCCFKDICAYFGSQACTQAGGVLRSNFRDLPCAGARCTAEECCQLGGVAQNPCLVYPYPPCDTGAAQQLTALPALVLVTLGTAAAMLAALL